VVCTDATRAAGVADRLRDDGWSISAGWDLPWQVWDVSAARAVCTGPLDAAPHVHGALLAAARGAGVVALAGDCRRLLERFVEDLLRFGPVQLHSCGEPSEPLQPLRDEERRLLELLAAGVTLGAAAAQLHISRRTADRRLAAARAALAVATTAEAVIAFGHDPNANQRRVA
jgi:DNA-binding NarL/FixJ family response regulator